MSDWTPMLPNDRFGSDQVIIASVIYSDDDTDGRPRDEWTLLLLNPQPPYFTVVIYDRRDDKTVWGAAFVNIVPAVDAYRDNGGDY